MPLKAFIVLFFCVGIASFSWANPTVYTEPNPPFNFREKGVVQGLALDLLEASLATIRPRFSQEEIHLAPWKEVYEKALEHPTTFLISASRLKERETLFQWVGPIATVRLGAISKRTLEIPNGKSAVEVLKNFKIATIKETSAEKVLFKEIGENSGLNIIRVSTPLQGYKMLEYGRVDVLVYTDLPFVYHLVNEKQDVAQYKMAHVLLNTDYYIAAGKDVPKEQISIMQTQLNRLKERDAQGSSMYERIMERYFKGAVLNP